MTEKQRSAEDKKWRAESDANALIEVETITQDAERYNAAQKAMERIMIDTQKRLDALRAALKKKAKETKTNGS
jgi:hypothetical protein